ncbi:MAG: methionine synthase [Clostridia bacterium]|nr:methionine synthase [Clostridia bacterium]
MEGVAQDAEQRFVPRFIYRVSAVEHRPEGEWLSDLQLLLPGNSARKMLAECQRAAVLVCTLGLGFEQHMRLTQARDMSQAVLLDACGSALVEAGCDAAEKELAARFPGVYLTDRFSPGYGDLPLDLQPAICRITDSQRRLGVYVTESCLMTPQKSVTAIIGMADKPQRARIRGCAYCAMKDTCALRKGGHSCDD